MRGKSIYPRKKRERHSGPPCPHYPHKFRTEAAHQAKLASRRQTHHRKQKTSLDYRLRAVLRTIFQRCNDPLHKSYRWYGAKGIRTTLTFKQIKTLWLRDNASAMRKPSIDRASSADNYEFSKCCFRELYDNQKRGWERKAERSKAIREGMKCSQLNSPQP